ncbi:hypothetical protein [Actinokineospora sp.]|uniref:hypothetical protein n=1 Tax=Actinokineospora sp. TaxID=1872133 RepID=UPI003D6B2996
MGVTTGSPEPTAYRYVDKVITMLAEQAPGLAARPLPFRYGAAIPIDNVALSIGQ